MKKLICLILSALMMCLCLTACADDGITDPKDEYPNYVPPVTEELSLNLYIVCDDVTTENAKVTVARKISQYTKDKFSTEVNVIYKSATEYEDAVKTAATSTDADIKADIVLITSKALMDHFMETEALADLTDIYGKFNNNDQLAASLREASMIDGKLYSVPNNRVVGSYEYLLINRSVTKGPFLFGTDKISGYTSYEAAKADIEAKLPAGESIDDYVQLVSGGMYEDKAAYEADGWFCNIISKPTVTVDDAFSSAFAIMKNTKNVSRAMDIIYQLNTDTELRNYLQYGIENTNYSVEVVEYINSKGETVTYENIVSVDDAERVYLMDITHTGNVFNAGYSTEHSWTPNDREYGNLQNRDSSFLGEPETPEQ